MKPRHNRPLKNPLGTKRVSSKRKALPRATPGSRKKTSIVLSPSGYICAQCGFQERHAEFAPEVEVPVWNKAMMKGQQCWAICPNDTGPDRALLFHLSGYPRRERWPVSILGQPTRLCVLSVLFSQKDGEETHGPAADRDTVESEAFLQVYLKKKGPDEVIDLQRLDGIEGSRRRFNIRHINDRWIMGGRTHLRYDDWAQKIFMHRKTDPDFATFTKLDGMVAALEPRLHSTKSRLHHTLYAGIDLTLPVDEQISRIKETTLELRDYLYRFTSQGRTRDRTGNLWRDLYIYLLATLKSRTHRQIGDEVFAADDVGSRIPKVANALRKVRSALDRADIKP